MLSDLTIALTMRVTQAANYIEPRDSISHDWIHALDALGARINLVPNLLNEPDKALSRIAPDLVILTGGEDVGTDQERDGTERRIFDYCERNSLPTLGVCRGMQLINSYYGGRVGTIENHVATSHSLNISEPFDAFYGSSSATNSFHTNAISPDTLAAPLRPWATDEESYVEGFCHETLPVVGVMWHPERTGHPEADHHLILKLAREGAFWV